MFIIQIETLLRYKSGNDYTGTTGETGELGHTGDEVIHTAEETQSQEGVHNPALLKLLADE